MRDIKNVLNKVLGKIADCDNRMVEFYASNEGYLPIDPPRMAKEFECPFCGCKDFFLFMVDAEKRAWLCGRVCEASKLPDGKGATTALPMPRRALEWQVLAELSGIGDRYYGVKFENIKQNDEILDSLKDFVKKPCSFLIFRGTKGTGKTYAAMAVCERFTRKSDSCVFTTQKRLMNDYVESFKEEKANTYIKKIYTTELLVIDEFGLAEAAPSFMSFFHDLVDSRLQWSNRGTIITTNLENVKFANYCGEALLDRMLTGEFVNFNGPTMREPYKKESQCLKYKI